MRPSGLPSRCLAGTIEGLTETDVLQLRQDGLPAAPLGARNSPKPLPNADGCRHGGSGKQVKDALGRNAVTSTTAVLGWDDNKPWVHAFAVSGALFGRFYLVRLGKKKYHLFEIG